MVKTTSVGLLNVDELKNEKSLSFAQSVCKKCFPLTMGQAKGRLTSVAKFQTSLTGFLDALSYR